MSDIDLINEYKDQVRILKQEVAELNLRMQLTKDVCKS